MHKRPDFKCLRMDLLAADILLARTGVQNELSTWVQQLNDCLWDWLTVIVGAPASLFLSQILAYING